MNTHELLKNAARYIALSSITNTMQVIQDYNQPIIDNLIQYRLSQNRSPFSL